MIVFVLIGTGLALLAFVWWWPFGRRAKVTVVEQATPAPREAVSAQRQYESNRRTDNLRSRGQASYNDDGGLSVIAMSTTSSGSSCDTSSSNSCDSGGGDGGGGGGGD